MGSVINYIVKHKVTSILAALTVIGSVVVSVYSGNVFLSFLIVLCTILPLLIWVIDTVRGDAENNKLSFMYDEMRKENDRVKFLNSQIAEKNNEIDLRNSALEKEMGIKRNSEGEVVDSNLRWKEYDKPNKDEQIAKPE